MPSKMVNDRKKLNRALRAALAAHEAEALDGLRERLGPFLEEGEDLSGLTTLHAVLARFLEARETDLVAADERIYSNRLDNRSPLRRRDEAVKAVRASLIAARAVMRGAFGPEVTSELLAIEGSLTEDPLLLHQHGLTVVARLRDPERATPARQLLPITVDREIYAAELEPLVEELGLALHEVELDRKFVVSAQAAKNRAMEAHDQDSQSVAGFLVFLCRLGGKQLMSERVRPVSRRRPSPEDVETLTRSVERDAPATLGRDDGGGSPRTAPPAADAPANANQPRAA